jgi:hypothetical protein
MGKPIFVAFKDTGTDEVTNAFDKVGNSSKSMAKQVDDSASSHVRLGEKVGNNEQKFMGAADLLDGLGATFGVNTQGATALARGLGDLSGGFEIVSGIIPGLSGLFPKLASAMTFVSAHPLLIAVLVGGAIIAGLVMLEKKFGLVSGAVKALGGVFSGIWPTIKSALNMILGGIESFLNAISAPMRLFSKLPGIPDLPMVNLPRLDVGGTVLQTGIAVVHRGEVVSPAVGSPSSSAGGTINVFVAGSVVTDQDLIDAVHAGLQRKQQRTGSLGLAA